MDFAISMAKTVAHLIGNGIDVCIKRAEMSCAVDMSRNRLVADFLGTDCTHLLFIDDDMGWDHDAVYKMLLKDKEFIAAAGPKKQEDEVYAATWYCNPDGTPVVEDGLFKAERVGGAFCLLKRSVFDKILLCRFGLRCTAIHEKYGYRFFEPRYTYSTWETEDYSFCDLYTGVGGEIWIYPDVSFTHAGIKLWKGNLHNFMLKKEPTMTADQPVPDQIKRLLSESYLDRVAKNDR